MAFLGTVRTSYRIGRAADRPKRTRRPLLVLAAQALGTAAARLPSWAALRTLLLTVTAFVFIDVAAFHFGQWVGYAAIGVSLLIVEALTGGDG